MNIRGFLRWQFEGSLRSLSFYGFALAVLGGVAFIGGCPQPWPGALALLGIGLGIVDAVCSWVRFSYAIYRLEQDRIIRELEKKEINHGN